MDDDVYRISSLVFAFWVLFNIVRHVEKFNISVRLFWFGLDFNSGLFLPLVLSDSQTLGGSVSNSLLSLSPPGGYLLHGSVLSRLPFSLLCLPVILPEIVFVRGVTSICRRRFPLRGHWS